jgi:hypothetical protein
MNCPLDATGEPQPAVVPGRAESPECELVKPIQLRAAWGRRACRARRQAIVVPVASFDAKCGHASHGARLACPHVALAQRRDARGNDARELQDYWLAPSATPLLLLKTTDSRPSLPQQAACGAAATLGIVRMRRTGSGQRHCRCGDRQRVSLQSMRV